MGFQKFVLILYSQLQHVGGKNFVAQRKVLKFEDIINMTFQSNNVPNFRLSASNIQRYINYCRKAPQCFRTYTQCHVSIKYV